MHDHGKRGTNVLVRCIGRWRLRRRRLPRRERNHQNNALLTFSLL